MSAQVWRVGLRDGDEIVVDVCDALTGTPLADCTTAEQLDYMRATARLHDGAAPATAEGRCDGNVDGDSVVGYVAAELLMRKYDVVEILSPGDAPRATLTAERDAAVAQVAGLRAIVEGRTTAPTDAEIDAHAETGGLWVIHTPHGVTRGGFTATTSDPDKAREYRERAAHYPGTRWIALDATGRPCAWPVVGGGA